MSKYAFFHRLPAAATLCTGVLIAPMVMAGSLSFNFNFDGVASGTPANSAIDSAAIRVSFVNAVYEPLLDGYGDPISGSERWMPDPDPATPAVVVEDPSTYAYGPAPSGTNALDARWQPVLMQFANPVWLDAFSVILDNSSKGNPFPVPLLFLDATGTMLKSMDIDQTILSLTIAVGPVGGVVSSVLLPAGAFYDDIGFTAVPEPATWVLLAGGLPLLSGVARRRFA